MHCHREWSICARRGGSAVANGDPDELLMQLAWKSLWTTGTPHYLSTAIVRGAHGNGVTVTALGQLEITEAGPLPLGESSIWRDVSADLAAAVVGGLDSMSDGGMTYASSTGAFSAAIGIGQATFNGNYASSGSGIAGCAVESTAGLLKPIPAAEAMTGAAGRCVTGADHICGGQISPGDVVARVR